MIDIFLFKQLLNIFLFSEIDSLDDPVFHQRGGCPEQVDRTLVACLAIGMPDQVAQRTDQITMGQRSSANYKSVCDETFTLEVYL